MECYIYLFPNGKRYVGQTVNTVEERAKKGKGYTGQIVEEAFKEFGWESVIITRIPCSSSEELDQKEKELIAQYKTTDPEFGYNRDSGGQAAYTHSEATKKLMSELQKGENNSFYGHHHTEETKAKLSAALKGKESPWKGKTLSEEHKAKIRATTNTEEVRQKMRDHSGQAKKIKNVETGEIFSSAAEAARKYAVNSSARDPAGAIRNVCRGKTKTSYGYHWVYIEGE